MRPSASVTYIAAGKALRILRKQLSTESSSHNRRNRKLAAASGVDPSKMSAMIDPLVPVPLKKKKQEKYAVSSGLFFSAAGTLSAVICFHLLNGSPADKFRAKCAAHAGTQERGVRCRTNVSCAFPGGACHSGCRRRGPCTDDAHKQDHAH